MAAATEPPAQPATSGTMTSCATTSTAHHAELRRIGLESPAPSSAQATSARSAHSIICFPADEGHLDACKRVGPLGTRIMMSCMGFAGRRANKSLRGGSAQSQLPLRAPARLSAVARASGTAAGRGKK